MPKEFDCNGPDLERMHRESRGDHSGGITWLMEMWFLIDFLDQRVCLLHVCKHQGRANNWGDVEWHHVHDAAKCHCGASVPKEIAFAQKMRKFAGV